MFIELDIMTSIYLWQLLNRSIIPLARVNCFLYITINAYCKFRDTITLIQLAQQIIQEKSFMTRGAFRDLKTRELFAEIILTL